MTKHELLMMAEDDELDQEALDDMVHDIKSLEASAINNGGQTEQVEYLIEELTLAELLSSLGL